MGFVVLEELAAALLKHIYSTLDMNKPIDAGTLEDGRCWLPTFADSTETEWIYVLWTNLISTSNHLCGLCLLHIFANGDGVDSHNFPMFLSGNNNHLSATGT